jgi:hypothetical protein
MATFTELLAEVYAITNRPDLVVETKTAIKAATLKAHNLDFFYKDIFETSLQWDAAAYLQTFEYRSYIPRWRSLKYIRKFDVTSDTPGEFFTILDPTDILDKNSVHKDNAAYVAGEILKLRSATTFDYALMGCYLQPDITEDSYSSWIAVEFPYVIVFEAAAAVFKMVGFDEQSATWRQENSIWLQELKNSNIVAVGY